MARKRMIDPQEQAEFRGFFFGEGCLDLRKSSSGRGLIPRARIALRRDDVLILYWIQDMLGGSVVEDPKRNAFVWTVSGKASVTDVLELLTGGMMPSKKRYELQLMRVAIALMPRRGAHLTDAAADELQNIHTTLKAFRRMEGNDGA